MCKCFINEKNGDYLSSEICREECKRAEGSIRVHKGESRSTHKKKAAHNAQQMCVCDSHSIITPFICLVDNSWRNCKEVKNDKDKMGFDRNVAYTVEFMPNINASPNRSKSWLNERTTPSG
jgi:hypothetical protein